MTKTRYKELQNLTTQYGEETISFFKKSKDLGRQIISAYSESLGAEKTVVRGVPPFGDFEPRAEYRDAAFSTYHRGVIYLEPITLGICTEIANLKDIGATWVRTVVEFSPEGNQTVVAVGERRRRFTIPHDSTSDLTEICDAIYEDVQEAFTLELDEARGDSRMGFIGNG